MRALAKLTGLSRIVTDDTRYLSASEVLWMLTSMADRMDTQFTPDRLKHWRFMGDYTYLKGYQVFARDAYLHVGLVPFLPSHPFGEQQEWMKFERHLQHPGFKFEQSNLRDLLPHLNVVGETDNDLVPVDYKITFCWDAMPGLFYECEPDGFEYTNVPKPFWGVCASMLNFAQRYRGKKEMLEMNEDLRRLLGSPLNNVPVIGRYDPGDLHVYNGRMFFFGHQSQMFYTSSLHLKWGFALFDSETKEPIAYTLFNDERSQRLLTG